MRSYSSLVLVVVSLALVLVVAGCSGAGTNPPAAANGSAGGGSASSASAPTVSIANFAFSPADLTVKSGTTVTWTNNDSVAHTVTSDSGVFDSQSLAPGATFNYTFAKPGTYPYHCSVHTSMTAKVVVQ